MRTIPIPFYLPSEGGSLNPQALKTVIGIFIVLNLVWLGLILFRIIQYYVVKELDWRDNHRPKTFKELCGRIVDDNNDTIWLYNIIMVAIWGIIIIIYLGYLISKLL